jgi:IclR family KDG regulon transcriptional repressor
MAEAKPKKDQKEPGVQSIRRAFTILEAVSLSPEGLNLADLSKKVGLHNSTV